MRFLFADDAKQRPSRDGMGPLVAVGGVILEHECVRATARRLDRLCERYRFPAAEEFKWSPGRGQWMRDHLLGEARAAFWTDVVRVLRDAGAVAVIAAADTKFRPAHRAATPELDVTYMLLERFDRVLRDADDDGVVVIDMPSGGAKQTRRFLSECIAKISTGTKYAPLRRFALPVLATESHWSRLLQAADLVTSCILAYVAGEERFSPPVVRELQPLLRTNRGRVGGCGVKLHPDYRYANLYHWLFGDRRLATQRGALALPTGDRPYSDSAGCK